MTLVQAVVPKRVTALRVRAFKEDMSKVPEKTKGDIKSNEVDKQVSRFMLAGNCKGCNEQP